MAKRREDEEESSSFSWYDQPLYDADDDDDPRDPRPRDDDKKSSDSGGERKPQSTGGKHVGLVGGCFIVILNAVLSILIFLVIGVGLVVAGRATGILSETSAPAPSAPSSEEVQPETGQAETVEEVQPTEVACNPDGWWSTQRATFDYFVTTYDRVTLATPAEPLETLAAQMQARRDESLAQPLDPCMSDVQGIFTQGMDQMISAAQTLAAGDRNGSLGLSDSADDAFSNTLIALWEMGVVTDSNTPPALNLPRGGNCDAASLDTWVNRFRQQWGQIYTLLVQIDVVAQPGVARATLDSVSGLQRNVEAITPPDCAMRPQEFAEVALLNYIAAANFSLQGDADTARERASAFSRAYVNMNAWLEWIGAGMV